MVQTSNLRLQARSDCFLSYFQADYFSTLNEWQQRKLIEKMLASRKLAYKGTFSTGAKKRMSRSIDILIQVSKITYGLNQVTGKRQRHFLSYITLTIPSHYNISAQQGYDLMLKHFLQWLRRTKKVNTYIWKAEFQERGQLHYHITTPAWIHYQEIKDKWNNLLRSNHLMEEYIKETGDSNPNSTDIHEVRNITGIAGYLKKEYYKSIQNQQTTGKIWDCSANLKSQKFFSVYFDMKLYYQSLKMEESQVIEFIDLEQCKVIKGKKVKLWDQLLTIDQLREYDNWKQSIRNHRNES
jgi:hypothetical protein